MPSETQTRMIVVLVGILLAVVAVSVVILKLLPDGGTGPIAPTTDTTTQATTSTDAVTPVSTGSDTTGFNLRVLQTSGYLGLDRQAVSEGALPVQAPLTAGKANPFQ